MKSKCVILLLIVCFIVSCGRNRNKIVGEYTPPDSTIGILDDDEETRFYTYSVNIRDSLIIHENLGEVLESHYEGTLPAADGPGIVYDLTIWEQERNDEGVFHLSTTYLRNNDEDDRDHTYITEGYTKNSSRKHIDGQDEFIYELIPIDGTSPLYFVKDGEDLTMLNQAKEQISSPSNHNYTLKRK